MNLAENEATMSATREMTARVEGPKGNDPNNFQPGLADSRQIPSRCC